MFGRVVRAADSAAYIRTGTSADARRRRSSELRQRLAIRFICWHFGQWQLE